jgi:hypothetical protein
VNDLAVAPAPRDARYLHYLAGALFATLGGLPLGSFIGGLTCAVVVLIVDAAGVADLPAAAGLGLMIAAIAIVVGFLPAFLYGAPLYALLVAKRRANFVSVALLGGAPGLVLVLMDPAGFGGFVLGFGIAVALATHHIARPRWERRARGA